MSSNKMATHSYRTRSSDRKPTVFVRAVKPRRMQPGQTTTVSQVTVNPKFGPIHIVTRRQAANSFTTRRTLTPPACSAPNRLLSPSVQRPRPNSALSTRQAGKVSPAVKSNSTATQIVLKVQRNKNEVSNQKMSTKPKNEENVSATSSLISKDDHNVPSPGIPTQIAEIPPANNSVKTTLPSTTLTPESASLDQDEGGAPKEADLTAPREKVRAISEDDSAAGRTHTNSMLLHQHIQQAPCGLQQDSSLSSCDQSVPTSDSANCAKSQSRPTPALTVKRASPASNSTLSGDATPNKKSRESSAETIDLEDSNQRGTLASTLDLPSFVGASTLFNNHNIQNFSCDTCKLDFQSARMLQQHNQQFHADKNYVCEICSKAFRFRSNLAEHRSVHTALKPFVCKFCGKSSRLKGNLTKHILKHHKSEQLDYIGTDEIIIKKGKKSVKDPMAIEFLEKSMIVMTPTQAQSPGLFNSQTNGGNSSRHSTSNLSASDGSMTPLNGQKPENGGMDERCFLMSLGLDSGSLDLKAESSESDSSVVGGPSTTNDQLLEKCNIFMDTSTKTNPQSNDDDELNEEEEDETPATSHPLNPATTLLFNALQQTLANKSQRSGQDKIQQRSSFLDGLADHLQNSNKQNGSVKATTCPKCGKHVRKPRDLITHLATIHGIAPSGPLATALQSQSNGQKIGEASSGGVQADLRQLLQLVLELKSTNGQVQKMEQVVSSIDSRVCRLEKQLEMALNSIYTLVQLQTGINSQLSRFKEETNDQLRAIAQEVAQQKE